MASTFDRHRLWRLLLLTLVLVTLTGHVVEVAGAASVDHSKLTLATGCLHAGVLLPGVPALPLAFIPHFVLSVAPPSVHEYCIPTPLHPPISTASH